MGFFDRLFGAPEPQRPMSPAPARQLTPDELAIERYRYLLRTAPPEAIEQVHAEAFAKLTPEQRQLVYRALADQAPAGERLVSDEPSALARAATRQELRAPGSMERAFANAGAPGGQSGAPGRAAGPSFGSMFGGSLLGSIAGVVVGTAIADAILPDATSFDAGGDPGATGADAGSVEASGDAGGDFGGFGGDFGGGDFGGGDFGF